MEWEQERHDLKRQLAGEQASRQFLEEELEILQKELKEKENNIDYMIKSLKEKNEQLSNDIYEWKTKVENLEELRETENKQHIVLVNDLRAQLSLAKINQDSHVSSSLCNIQVFKDQNKVLEHDLEILKSKIENMSLENMELIKKNEESREAKDELNSVLTYKRQELTSCMEHCSALQEEVILLKVENDAFKATPQPHANKGNSVFAEVDDNRKALKNNLDKLAEKYNELKKVLKFKSSEVLKLRAEKSSLLRQVQEVCTNNEHNESMLMKSYKSRIKDLEKSMEDSRKAKHSHSVLSNNSLGDYKAVDAIFAAKNKEIETLKERVEKLSQNHIMQSETIFFLEKNLETKTSQLAYERSEKMRVQEELIDAKILTEK